jgi:hypothetical protein
MLGDVAGVLFVHATAVLTPLLPVLEHGLDAVVELGSEPRQPSALLTQSDHGYQVGDRLLM